MSTNVFSIHCDALEGATLVGFKGTEALSRPFEFDLFFTIPVGTDVKPAIGARATLTADRDDGRDPMSWHGILAGLRLVHETAERALYRASLVPALWLLQHHIRSFVFTKKKIDAFVTDTLKDGGLQGADFQLHTDTGAYPTEEFVCQYRESHLDFLHRWFEREGLYYYFEHPDSPGATEKLVIVDDKAHHHPLSGDGHVRYFPTAAGDGTSGECFRELHADYRLLPASVLISDYNYANPAAPLTGERPVVPGAGQGKIREYGYRVFSDAEAKRLAQIKAQSLACRELTLTATGTYLGLRAGYTFQLEDAPSDLPVEYLAIEVRHAGTLSGASPLVRRYTGLDAKETYRVDVVAIPATTQFRTPQTTPWPRIYGFENGTIDGPGESQYAQIDDQGRYLVRFKFDVSDLPDGSTSTYLRMMQPHGGTTEGWHFPLRKGTEVMVSFQGGDPDRPVIAGVVPNAVQPSNVTSKNYTQNVLRTGGNNFLTMDDIDGGQLIEMSTPVDATSYKMGGPTDLRLSVPPWDPAYADEPQQFRFGYHLKTEGDAGFVVGGKWYQWVGSSHFLDVVSEGRTRYGGRRTLIVGGVSNENYLATRNTTIATGRSDTVKAGGMKQEISGGYFQKISPDGKQEVTGDWSHTVAGESRGKYGAWNSVIDGNVSITSTGGNIAVSAMGGEVTIISPSKINLVAPKVVMRGSEIENTSHFQASMFSGKEEVGGQSFCGTYLATTITGLSLGQTGTKIENAGVQVTRVGMAQRVYGVIDDKAPCSFLMGAVSALTLGLVKIG